MRTMNRWEPSRGATTLQEQLNRVLGDMLERAGDESNLTPWAPAVDIFETEHQLVVKADLPDVNPQDLDIRVENNILTIRGERKFENEVNVIFVIGLYVWSVWALTSGHPNEVVRPDGKTVVLCPLSYMRCSSWGALFAAFQVPRAPNVIDYLNTYFSELLPDHGI